MAVFEINSEHLDELSRNLYPGMGNFAINLIRITLRTENFPDILATNLDKVTNPTVSSKAS